MKLYSKGLTHQALGIQTETTQLRWDMNPTKTEIGTRTPCLLIEMAHVASGLNEAQVLYVSAQKEFSKWQSDR